MRRNKVYHPTRGLGDIRVTPGCACTSSASQPGTNLARWPG